MLYARCHIFKCITSEWGFNREWTRIDAKKKAEEDETPEDSHVTAAG
jgi:hypothetical protein